MDIRRARLALTMAALIIAAPAGGALASGGGGGGLGGLPSASVPQIDPAEEYAKGMKAYQSGKFKDAARAFDNVTGATPRDPNAWRMLGLSRAALNDPKGAAKALERALKLDPAPLDVHREYAIALARSKQPDKAAAQLADLKAKADACHDACPEASDLKAAIAAVEDALKPADPAAPKPAAAITAPGALLSAEAGDSAYVEAVSLINAKRFADALAALKRAESAFGPHPDVLTYEGYVWRKLGRLDMAEHYYRAALAISPEHRGASEYYGELKVIEGDLPAARALLARIDRQCVYGCVEAEDLRLWIEHGGDPAS
jgi:tetratricopeptide (TPR) repeat protein